MDFNMLPDERETGHKKPLAEDEKRINQDHVRKDSDDRERRDHRITPDNKKGDDGPRNKK
jgi:hypothetical protein